MMVVVDEHVNIHDVEEVAKYVSEHARVPDDFVFSQGPVDVLDHSCSKMSYGGKMGIDGTRKFDEELYGNETCNPELPVMPDKKSMQSVFPEIIDINDTLLGMGIPVLFISMKKDRKGHVRDLNRQLADKGFLDSARCVIYLEHNMDISYVSDAVWRFANNTDPKRDHFVLDGSDGKRWIVFDGTRKTKEFDGFDRDWPNILASVDETIRHVDEIWHRLGLGPMIESPSRRYSKQLYSGGAVAG
jgi:4-hydroxy-3-polyprenylbenzoate decarboxylase